MSDAALKTLRHSANSFMADLGVPVDVRVAILGNSGQVNARVYAHVSDGVKRAAISRLEGLFTGAVSVVFHPGISPAGEKNGGKRPPAGGTAAPKTPINISTTGD